MKRLPTIPVFLSVLCLLPGLSTAVEGPPSPEAVVAALYKIHDKDPVKGPFFQTKDKRMPNRYFTAALTDLIWKDLIAAKGEVGAYDFDPLYDAQDTDIKNFALRASEPKDDKVEVVASFENFGTKVSITFKMVMTAEGWRVADIRYRKGRSLVALLGGKP